MEFYFINKFLVIGRFERPLSLERPYHAWFVRDFWLLWATSRQKSSSHFDMLPKDHLIFLVSFCVPAPWPWHVCSFWFWNDAINDAFHAIVLVKKVINDCRGSCRTSYCISVPESCSRLALLACQSYRAARWRYLFGLSECRSLTTTPRWLAIKYYYCR